jgi:hypothetical protein
MTCPAQEDLVHDHSSARRKLIDDQILLAAHDDAGKPHHQVAGDDQLVLPQLVVPPPAGDQVQRAVHLGYDAASVATAPLCVQVPSAPGDIVANCLAHRFGQAVASAEAGEVDLAERLGALFYVTDGREEDRTVPCTGRRFDRASKIGSCDKPLLHDCGQQSACWPRPREAAGGDHGGGAEPV